MTILSNHNDYQAQHFTQDDFETKKVTEEYWCKYGIIRENRNSSEMPNGYLIIIRNYKKYEKVHENGIFIDIRGRVVKVHTAQKNLYFQVFSSKENRTYKVSIHNNVLSIQNAKKHKF